MPNLGELVAAVQRNCHISDAKHAADYTLCVFLLKMREFYRWEHDLPFAHTLPKEDVSDWLQQRERLWEDLESSPFESLPLAGAARDPFEADAINLDLIPRGYVYSAGYGSFHKPCFFLGALARVEKHPDCTVLVSTCEYARELAAPPAMLQGRTIYVRLESVRRFLWEKIEEANWHNNRDAIDRALAAYGFAADAEAALARMTEAESRTMILHERGELRAGEHLGPRWEEMLGALSRPHVEIMARAVRDILADCLVTLPALTGQENWASIHFYFANFGGMRRHLYPELVAAYRHAVEVHSTEPLARRVAEDAPRWLARAQSMTALLDENPDNPDCAIESLLTPDHATPAVRHG
jgi:hypothetical protein